MLRPYATGGQWPQPILLMTPDGSSCIIPSGRYRVYLGGEGGCELLAPAQEGAPVDPGPATTSGGVDGCDHGQPRGHSELPLPCSRCPQDQHEQMIAARIRRWLGPPRGPKPERPPLTHIEIVFEGDQVVERRLWR